MSPINILCPRYILCICVYIHTHTDAHTHTLYLYGEREWERARERERDDLEEKGNIPNVNRNTIQKEYSEV